MNDFKLCTVEQQRLKDWRLTHKCKNLQTLEDVDSFLTSSYEVCFRPSGVGPSVSIHCDCGEIVDITHWEHM